jgi:transposase
MEGPSAGLWGLEKYASALFSLERKRSMGKIAGNFYPGSRLRMVNGGCDIHQMPRTRGGSERREPENGRLKRGLNSKIHLAVDATGMPVRIIVTDGTTADCTQAELLITGLKAGFLLADKGYDSDEIVDKAVEFGMIPVIPPRKNRKNQREYDKTLYKKRHLVENAFLRLKQWRGISTRYAKNAGSFEAAVQIRCLMLWLMIS